MRKFLLIVFIGRGADLLRRFCNNSNYYSANFKLIFFKVNVKRSEKGNKKKTCYLNLKRDGSHTRNSLQIFRVGTVYVDILNFKRSTLDTFIKN